MIEFQDGKSWVSESLHERASKYSLCIITWATPKLLFYKATIILRLYITIVSLPYLIHFYNINIYAWQYTFRYFYHQISGTDREHYRSLEETKSQKAGEALSDLKKRNGILNKKN